MKTDTTILLAAILVFISAPARADFLTVSQSGSVGEVNSTNIKLNGNECVIRENGVCLKLKDDWIGNITSLGNGDYMVNGRKMSDFPKCDEKIKTDCLEKRP